jgi:hypothetical protein
MAYRKDLIDEFLKIPKLKSKVMKEMIITATFKGQDGSLKYKTHKEYKLKVVSYSNSATIEIEDLNPRPAGNCQYESMFSFLENWTNVKDVTTKEKVLLKKSNKKEIAINFTDLCKNLKTIADIKRALDFYNEEFDPLNVMNYFQNWSYQKPKTGGYRNGVVLTNNNTQGWKVKIWTNDEAEYTFCSGSNGTDKPEEGQWLDYPRTMSEFISDCLRHQDVELLFSKEAIEKIYG